MPGMMYNVALDPTKLKPHKENVEIYGSETVDTDLAESIKQKGILEPIVIKDDNTILSGHRRWLAAKSIGLDKVPCRTISFNDDLDELESLIEFNRQREKTFTQRMKEAERLKIIESERAKIRQVAELKQYKNTENTVSATLRERKEEENNGKTSNAVAEKVGMKARTYEKAAKVWEKAKEGDEKAKELIKKVDSGDISINKAYKDIRTHEKRESVKIKPPNPIDATETYNVILCDPPWKYQFSETNTREIENHYPTMTHDELKNLSFPAMDNSVLLMWATAPKLKEAIELMDSWGFTYRTCAMWDKEMIGMGYWFRGQHEILLVGVKGSFSPPLPENRYSSVIREKRTKHSKKPECVYDMIEKMFPNGIYLEIFAREARENWKSWGNQL
jgi:N6-adenosine-specific RNA methylase IME4/ParB-like chromosome segregation protein Spo0J